MLNLLCVIPARSKSVRVKDKNIRLLGGRPLIAWTIEAALESKVFSHVVVSTDSLHYQDIARTYGAEAPFLRPAEISTDCDTALVVRHCVEYMIGIFYKMKIDAVMTLQPTSPFRSAEDIRQAVNVFSQTARTDDGRYYDSLVSVTDVTQHPAWMFRERSDTDFNDESEFSVLESYLGIPLRFLSGIIAQDLPKLLFPNGAIYISSLDLIDKNRLFGEMIAPYHMPWDRSVDIEEEKDFQLCEAILKTRGLK